ncbi:aminotransferase class V-fold PLP-dependent enzyme [Aliikangiella marina]|uniref:Aminotransferase class V-fold PLP-dependent enzyme n=1 Tax=Aliikangiella marina TaxID=1712262 RepID=A0A545TDW0_9GAMM|nr:aminotransferase class V-fold PLP-dependent enzyme [Aliikangiella marina]TQV75390.1 aminotransferase class V-fold PLP-dependent enzyme [Aliikangiella marina]
MSLQEYFSQFRKGIVGQNLIYRDNQVIYADWIASGRLYQPIEEFMLNRVGPLVSNTHTETSFTGSAMTRLYHDAQVKIKQHVNADDSDVLVCAGTGMTGVINKFQRILGLRVPEKWADRFSIPESEKPVVFVTHMEHHSNQTTWNECAITLIVVPENEQGFPDESALEQLLEEYRDRPMKIGAFTACSNVTGIKTNYYEYAKIMHRHGGFCFVDFAASAPYVDIDMHPETPEARLDAVMFSPHKFLGGPGSSGVLVFNKELYKNKIPDHPGGGTVTWTNPWGEHRFFEDIEVREDGGTPGFLQAIRTALAIELKEAMGTDKIQARESEIVELLFNELEKIPQVNILHDSCRQRLSVVSFYIIDIHYNLMVRLLSDRFGIQTRGGCSCAGTYGHILLGVDQDTSCAITNLIDEGDLSLKPGWVRISLHPTSTDQEVKYIAASIKAVIENIEEWKKDYRFEPGLGDYVPKIEDNTAIQLDEFSPV